MMQETSIDTQTKHNFRKKRNMPSFANENVRRNEADESKRVGGKMLPDVFNVSMYNKNMRETK